jgi:hypothetical protein
MSWQLSSSLSSSFIVKKKQTSYRSWGTVVWFNQFLRRLFFSFPDDALLISNRCVETFLSEQQQQKIWQKKNYYKLVENLLCVALLHFPICIFHGLLYFYKIFTFSFSFFTDRETLILNLFFSVCWSLIKLYGLFFNITFWFARLGLFDPPPPHPIDVIINMQEEEEAGCAH